MSKVLTDKEALEIISKAIDGEALDCGDNYLHFLADLGELIADHFGGEFVTASEPIGEGEGGSDSVSRYCLHFEHNECVPEDGGVYAAYDTDVTIEDWKEAS